MINFALFGEICCGIKKVLENITVLIFVVHKVGVIEDVIEIMFFLPLFANRILLKTNLLIDHKSIKVKKSLIYNSKKTFSKRFLKCQQIEQLQA